MRESENSSAQTASKTVLTKQHLRQINLNPVQVEGIRTIHSPEFATIKSDRPQYLAYLLSQS